MKTLLTNLQTRLSEQVTYLPMRDMDLRAIYVVPDENDLPELAAFPCFGLKDGGISYDVGGGTRRETLMVTLIAYVSIPEQEASMMGEGENPGVLALMDAGKAALDGWVPDGFTCADMLSESPSIRLVKMDPTVSQEQWPFLQKKTATFRYWREVTAP